ncbi:FeoC-like transcriptional regulator [Candidatus Palibaumannia cicadellinicola]|uniref:Fe-S dependent transcriptional regulator of feoABC n=1 Tax=Candidatus Palibaumannia cicadellinicola TaxID=186490 RepID=A0A088MX32_9GAMM|nr:Fe-S dependent transcriptional regulator of feoABC [Candidatus Baumannia cicadellinicola]
MSKLLQIRDTLVLLDQADARTLSLLLNIPKTMTQAILEILEIRGQIEKVSNNTIKTCEDCSHNCNLPYYRLRSPKS